MITRAIFTALPTGDWSRRPQIALFTTLNLDPGSSPATLTDFRIARHWPRTIRSAQFTLFGLNGGTVARLGVGTPRPYAPADDAQLLWQTMLPDDTRVSPETPQTRLAAPLQTYDFAHLADAVDQVYQPLLRGQSTSALSTVAGLDWWGTQELIAELGPDRRVSQSPFRRFAEYHLPEQLPPGGGNLARITVEESPDDFDRRFSEAGNYPSLFRYLGLILDLDVVLAPGVSLPSQGMLAVMPELPNVSSAELEMMTPWSRYERFSAGDSTFACMAGDAARQRGFCAFPPRSVRLVQYDLDNAVYGLMQAASIEKSSGRGEIPRIMTSSTPPALISAGYSLYHEQIGADLRGSGSRAAELSRRSAALTSAPDPAGPVLAASDTEAGWRVDVHWSRTGRWHSLSERTLEFAVDGRSFSLDPFGPSEGMVGLATSSTVNPDTGNSSADKSSQRLFGWLGWSLVVSRLGTALEEPRVPDEPPPAPRRWQVTEQVSAESLAKLRFGDSYKFRIRSVDIAGTSWSLQQAGAIAATLGAPEIDGGQFLRLEPVNPPRLAAPTEPALGETASVLAVHRGSRDVSRRLAHPPAISFDLLEKHGVLDPLSDDESFRLLDLIASDPSGAGQEVRFPYVADPLASGIVATIEGFGEELALGALPYRGGIERQSAQGIEIELRTGPFSARMRGRKITVTLPLGASRRLRLSSAIDAARRPLLKFDGGGAEPSSAVAPAVDLLLVHPSRTPLRPPAKGDPALSARARHNTHIAFYDAGLTTHEETTARVTFEASWRDVFDDPAQPGWTIREGSAVIATQDIELDATHPLGFTAARAYPSAALLNRRTGAQDDTRAVGVFRAAEAQNAFEASNSFDFQDTRGRNLTVTPVAHTRHAEFFPAETVEPASSRPAPGRLAGEAFALEVPSTNNPQKPSVEYILPTYVLDRERPRRREIRQTMSGWALRVYLRRDWREDERLAILFGRSGFAERYSAIAQDPLVTTSKTLASLAPTDIAGERIGNLLLPLNDEYEQTGEAQHGDAVDIVHLTPQFDAEKNLRFADIIVRPQPGAFLPFLRLFLARYVRNSIGGAELSRATSAQWSQPAANRSITTVELGDGDFLVTVLADAADEAQPSRTRFTAHVEYTEFNASDEYAWAKIDGSEVALEAMAHPTHMAWRARMRTPPWRLLGHRRIVVRELFELKAMACAAAESTRRLVAFDIINL